MFLYLLIRVLFKNLLYQHSCNAGILLPFYTHEPQQLQIEEILKIELINDHISSHHIMTQLQEKKTYVCIYDKMH